jgi:hypothetical protein
MNRGGLGARSLNLELQRLLNPPGEVRVERFGWTFCPGDKVMQVANDYDKEVFNGDLGLVRAVDAEAGELLVDFDGREVAHPGPVPAGRGAPLAINGRSPTAAAGSAPAAGRTRVRSAARPA